MGHFDDFKSDRRRGPVTTKPSNAQQAAAEKRGRGVVSGGVLGFLSSISDYVTPVVGGVQEAFGTVDEGFDATVGKLRGAGVTGENLQRSLGNVIAGNPEYFTGGSGAPQGAGDPRNVSPSPEFIERMSLTQVSHLQEEIADLDELQKHVLPEGQALYDKFRAEKEKQLADINLQLMTLNQRAQQQHEFGRELTAQAFPEGLIPGADPEATRQLNDLLDQAVEGGTGGTAPNLQAVIDSIVDSNLPEDEKLERLGWITDQATMRSELQGAIDSLVTDREATQELLALPMAEVLADPALFAQPHLNVDVQFDDTGRTVVAVLEEVEGVLEQQYGTNIPDEIMVALDPNIEGSILDLVSQGVLDPNSEQFIQRVQTDLPGVNPAMIQSAVNQGLQTAAIRHQAWNEALDQNQYRPGSIELVYALFQAALGTGMFEPEVAAQIAESENIHHIIDVYSDGKVGAQGTGGRQGLGMLTPEAYERFGLPMDGTAESELMALVMYMMEPGNPALRMQTFFDTGVWGN